MTILHSLVIRKYYSILPSIISRDLDQASMEAVAALLAGLPLQPEESDRGDLQEAKSQLFLKYVIKYLVGQYL